jgi:hypothetical protein
MLVVDLLNVALKGLRDGAVLDVLLRRCPPIYTAAASFKRLLLPWVAIVE